MALIDFTPSKDRQFYLSMPNGEALWVERVKFLLLYVFYFLFIYFLTFFSFFL